MLFGNGVDSYKLCSPVVWVAAVTVQTPRLGSPFIVDRHRWVHNLPGVGGWWNV